MAPSRPTSILRDNPVMSLGIDVILSGGADLEEHSKIEQNTVEQNTRGRAAGDEATIEAALDGGVHDLGCLVPLTTITGLGST